MAGGLRYETGRDMPPGMQELTADKLIQKMREGSAEDAMVKAVKDISDSAEMVAYAIAAAIRERDRRMEQIRRRIWSKVCAFIEKNGRLPAAIGAGGEYFAAMADDQKHSVMKDWVYLWRGIPLYSIEPLNKVYLIPQVDEINVSLQEVSGNG